MSELWWAEAAIHADCQPNWTTAHEYLDQLTAQQIFNACPEYVYEIPDDALVAAGLQGRDFAWEDEDILRYPRLADLIKPLLHRDLHQIAELMEAPRHLLCRFEAAGLNVYVCCSGFSSGGPDRLVDAWLRLDNLGVFQRAGFVHTRPLG